MSSPARDLYRKTHETISQVTRDMEGDFHFNSAVAQLMELLNAIEATPVKAEDEASDQAVFRCAIESLVLLLSPFAPHVAEELWQELGYDGGILSAAWPDVNTDALKRDTVDIVVQVNGKVRGKLSAPAGVSREQLEKDVLAAPSVQRYTDGKTVRKIIVIPNKLVNVVVS
jgi:leucyl-tRNA synthetase